MFVFSYVGPLYMYVVCSLFVQFILYVCIFVCVYCFSHVCSSFFMYGCVCVVISCVSSFVMYVVLSFVSSLCMYVVRSLFRHFALQFVRSLFVYVCRYSVIMLCHCLVMCSLFLYVFISCVRQSFFIYELYMYVCVISLVRPLCSYFVMRLRYACRSRGRQFVRYCVVSFVRQLFMYVCISFAVYFCCSLYMPFFPVVMYFFLQLYIYIYIYIYICLYVCISLSIQFVRYFFMCFIRQLCSSFVSYAVSGCFVPQLFSYCVRVVID